MQFYMVFYLSIFFIFGEESVIPMMLRKDSNSMLNLFSGQGVMSDFIESEAEESEEEFDEKELKPKKTQRFMEEDGKI